MVEQVTLPLTGSGDATAEVAVNLRADGSSIQLVKLDLVNGQVGLLLAAALGPGVNVDLDAANIPGGKVGQLLAADIGASVPLRVDLQTVSGGRTNLTTIYTGLGGSKLWQTSGVSFHELTGGGTNHFGASVTNLSAWQTADARITLYWDEVNP